MNVGGGLKERWTKKLNFHETEYAAKHTFEEPANLESRRYVSLFTESKYENPSKCAIRRIGSQ